ncbi:MAG: pseudouridine synthase [Bacteroidota bacterium]|nr:pseudouridine synthase [Ferruginibacter sp.]
MTSALHTPHHRYFKLHKPYDMVSQFVSTHDVNLLTDLDFDFPMGTHAIGRLDNHSEGLLLLTTNSKITRLLFSSTVPHERVYLVQVNNTLSEENLHRLRTGIDIRIKGGVMYKTPECEVKIEPDPARLFRDVLTPAIYGPHTWLTIALTEGKFHQVRKMMGAVKHRCKRLIRLSIESMELGQLLPGEVQEISEQEFFQQLRLQHSIIDPGD